MPYLATKALPASSGGMSYRDAGSGFPLVLIHGFPMDGSIWEAHMDVLKPHFRLLVPDLPGSGASPLTHPLGIATMSEAVYAMLQQEQITSCIMIGHSMGGYITLRFAAQYPQLLRGWGLFHSTAFPDTEEKKNGRLKSIQLMHDYGGAAFLRQMIPDMFAGRFRDTQRNQLTALIRSREEMAVASMEAYYRAMMERPDATAALRGSKVPVLFILGKEDKAAPLKDLLRQVSLPPTASIHIFEAVAHMGMLELPLPVTAGIIRTFAALCHLLDTKPKNHDDS
ncbi:alpha/beta hydrolase [Compostibacter hankyongensis]|uniref:Alpha/beta fold hydrolase n=1 Tax=Compostibacter hankyongensis TaxID=1007089 RepID=A0ABP8FG35_9BACT